MLLVYSATKNGATKLIPSELRTMIIAVAAGLILCLLISFLDYEVIIRLWPLVAIFCVLIMCALFIWGSAPPARPDARSWFDLKIFYFQPSELVKIGFIITFAVHLDAVKDHVSKFTTVLLLGIHALIPIGLVMATGDDGSALIFMLMFLGMMFAAGVHWGYFAAGFAAVAVAFPAIWALGDKFILNQDQKNRFLAILYPDLYAKNEAFQQNRGIGAIGSGQFFGQGLFNGNYTQSGAVPEILPCIGCTQPGKWHCYDVWQHSAAAVGALDLRGQDTRGVRVLCWATFLHDIAKPLCRSVGPDGAAHFKGHNQRGAQLARVILRRLKAPAYLVDGAVGLIAVHDAPLPADDVGILKLLNRSGAIFLRRLCALKYADLDAHANTPEVAARRADVAAFERRMNELAKTGCYTMRQLAVNGADLMDIGIPAGPGVGATLQTLLNDVMEGTLPNEREALLAAAVK